MRTKAIAVLLVMAAGLPLGVAEAAAEDPLGCPGVVEVPGGWLLTEDAACSIRLPGDGATFDFGGHTLTGKVLPLDRDQTMRNGTLVITGSQAWNGGFTVSRVTVRPLVPGG
jgi:hypothetical protein